MLQRWIIPAAVPLLFAVAFICGVFFRGLDQMLFMPALLSVIFVAFLLGLHGIRKGWDMPSAPPALWLAGFWLWMVIALIGSQVFSVSAVFTLLIGTMPLVFFMLVQYPDADRLIRRVTTVLAVIISVMAAWALTQFVFLSDLVDERIRHPMLNPNNLGVVIGVGIFLWLSLFNRAPLWGRVAIGVLMVLGLVGVFLTQSRGGMLGSVTGLGLFAVLQWGRFNLGFDRRYWKIYVGLGSVLLLSIFFMIVAMMVQRNGFHLVGGGMASITERFLIWGASLRMLWDNILFGPGLGLFYLIYPPYRHAIDTSDGFFVHMDPLQYGIELGVLAPVLFYGFGIAVLLRTIAAFRATERGDARRAGVIIPFCGLLCLMINAHVNFDLYMLPALMLAGVLLAAWYRGVESILGRSRYTMSFSNRAGCAFLIPACVLLFILTPVWVVRSGVAVYDVERAVTEIYGGDMTKARGYIDHAMRYGPRDYYRTYYADAQWHGKAMQANRDDAVSYNAAVAATGRSIHYNPYYVQAFNYQAVMHFLINPAIDPLGMAKSRAILEHALTLDPLSFDVRMGLARVYEVQGDGAAALRILTDIFDWRVAQKYAPLAYRQYVVDVMTRMNDPRLVEYTAETRKFADLIRNDPVAYNQRLDNWIDRKIRAGKARLGL